MFLFQEREHVLRLYAENDRLRIQELDDRKKIQHLLTLTQPVNAETTYFIKEPPAKVLVQQHIPPRATAGGDTLALSGRGPGGHKNAHSQNKKVENQLDENVDKETLLLTVEALRAQLEEQTRLCKEQVETLLEDRRVKAEEADVQHQRDADRVKSLADKLQNTQELLYESTKDYLELKYELRAKERSWMKEKDKLLQQLDHYKQQLDISAGIDPILGMNFSSSSNGKNNSANKGNLCYLKEQLQQTQQLADNYREQCIKLEEEVGRLREESDASKDLFKQRTEKATKRLGLMNTRYQNLEKRRAMEIEGYKNDIKMLRSRLKDVEKQLYKVSHINKIAHNNDLFPVQLTVGLSGDQDEEVLRAVRRTASNSKKLVGDLQTLKARIYSLENDTRHVHDL